MIAPLLVFLALAGITWRLLPFLTGLGAWVLVAAMALSLLAGIPVPAGVIVMAVTLWLTSQMASRSRSGEWRSTALRRIVG